MKIVKYKGFEQYGDRDPRRPIEYLVVHSFALSVNDMIKTCNELGVGPHYIIDEKGNVIQLVPENKTAWHAGKSFWHGAEKLNAASVGIELQNRTLGQTPFPEIQMKAFAALAKDIMRRHHILPQNVVGHSDVAPTRKADPGICFPWAEMAKKGIGIWPKEDTKVSSRAQASTLLKRIGYDVSDEKAAMYAFMRRFMPELVANDPDIMHMEENLPGFIQQAVTTDSKIRSKLCAVAKAYTDQTKPPVHHIKKQR